MLSRCWRWAALGAVLAVTAPGRAETPYYPVVAASDSPAAIGRPIAIAKPVVTLERPVASVASPAPVPPPGYREPGTIIRCQAPDGPYTPLSQSGYQPATSPPPSAPPVSPPPYGTPADGYIPGAPVEQPVGHGNGFWDHCRDWFSGNNGGGFNCQSDTAYESLITPVSNPFFYEDPRALTEVRPLFIWQTIPHNSHGLDGGNAFFYGLQGRFAFNDRWSIVINKLGGVTIDPHVSPGVTEFGGSHSGFAEINIGPKFTFLHNTTNNTVAAFGLNLDLPVGSSSVLQDTGTLSLDPYFTIGHTFGRTSWGQFNVVSTAGFNFAADNKRSDFWHMGVHLDYDVASAHRWYPLLELNWFHYTSSGSAHNLNFEGLDLGNFGSTGVAGQDNLSMALGFRYKLNEHVQFGIAAEFPLIRAQEIQDFRLTLDMILRY
jgi:hypothetical protein